MTPQPRDEAFRRDILANPDDDTARLIYADWLEEHGDGARAEFIRVQYRLAQLEDIDAERLDLEDRIAELLAVHDAHWRGEVPAVVRNTVGFARGFVEKLRCSPGVWRQQIEGLLRVAPIRELDVDDHFSEPLVLWRTLPHVERLRSLRFLLFSKERTVTFLRDNDLRRLEALDVTFVSDPDRAFVEVFSASRAFPRLAALRLCSSREAPEVVEALAEADKLPALRTLELRGMRSNAGVWRRFIEGPLLPQLLRLDLRFAVDEGQLKALLTSPRLGQLRLLNLESTLTNEGARALARCERLADLRSLNISHTGVRQQGVIALARSEYMANLRELHLVYVKLDEKGARELLGRHWPHLATLGLNRTWLTDAGVVALAEAGCFPELRRLMLGSNDKIASTGVKALAGASHLSNLRWLDLSATGVDGEGIRALGASPYLKRLTHLWLPTQSVTEASVTALTESPVFRGLRALSVGSSAPEPLLERLRKHFGAVLHVTRGA